MIEYHWLDGQACPKMFCDACGEEITEAKKAAVVFKNFLSDGERSSALYVHKDFVKGSCLTTAEEKIRSEGGEPGWMEIGEHMACLISNLGMTAKDIAKRLA